MAALPRREFLKTAALVAGMTTAASGGESPGAAAQRSAATPPQNAAPWIAHDLHTHTVYSDGAHPIPLHLCEARAFELDAVAITDHYTPGGKLAQSEAEFDRYLAEIQRERSAQNDVLVLKGVEATVLVPFSVQEFRVLEKVAVRPI